MRSSARRLARDPRARVLTGEGPTEGVLPGGGCPRASPQVAGDPGRRADGALAPGDRELAWPWACGATPRLDGPQGNDRPSRSRAVMSPTRSLHYG